MSRTPLVGLAALAVTAAVGLGACGSKAPSEAELRRALIDSGIEKPVATCTAKAVTHTLSDEELQELTDRGGGGAPEDDPDRTNDTADKVREALAKCRELGSEATTTTTVAPGSELTPTLPPTTAVAPTNDDEFNTTTPTVTSLSTTTVPNP